MVTFGLLNFFWGMGSDLSGKASGKIRLSGLFNAAILNRNVECLSLEFLQKVVGTLRPCDRFQTMAHSDGTRRLHVHHLHSRTPGTQNVFHHCLFYLYTLCVLSLLYCSVNVKHKGKGNNLSFQGRIFRSDDLLAELLGYESVSSLLGTKLNTLVPGMHFNEGQEQRVCALNARGNPIPIVLRVVANRDAEGTFNSSETLDALIFNH